MPNRRRQTKAQSYKEEKEISKVRVVNKLRPRTQNQANYIRTMVENDIIFCSGPPGAGKDFCSIGLACEYLINNKYKKIVITRPTIEVGSTLSALPGTVFEKVFPFMAPILDTLEFFLGKTELEHHMKFKTIEIVPLQYMRGLTFWNSFIVVDECQDATRTQLLAALTRLGSNSKMVLLGDEHQSDLPIHAQGAFSNCMIKLQNVNGIGISKLEVSDIQRSQIVKEIVERLY